MGSFSSQLPYLLIVLALFAGYGVAVRRGVLRDSAVLNVGAAVGAVAVAASGIYWWPLYQHGLIPFSIFLINPFIMTVCAVWCVYMAHRSQRVEDVATYSVGDTKILVRITPPSRLPDADALILPTSVTLRLADGIAGMIGTASGRSPEDEARLSVPVGPLKVIVTGAGDLRVQKIYHVAVSDYLAKVNEATLQRGIENAAHQARKDHVESVIVPIAALRGLSLADTTRAMVAGTLKHRKAFAEIVFAALSPNDGPAIAAEVAKQMALVEGGLLEKIGNRQ